MVKLIAMNGEEYAAFLERGVREYAEENVKAGYWSESEALQKSRQEHEKLLPQGLKTPDHYLYTIQDAEKGVPVGMLWMRANLQAVQPSGFIFDLFIDEAFRHQGYGTQAMLQLEEVARQLGLRQLGLHVFAHNRVALAAYEKLNYRVSSLNMIKDLTPAP